MTPSGLSASRSPDATQPRTLLSLFSDLTKTGFGDPDISVTRGYVKSKLLSASSESLRS